MSFDLPLKSLVAIFLVLVAVVPIIVLVVTRGQDWGATRAHEVSMRARLPFGGAEVARSVAARSRTLVRTNMWGLLAAIIAALAFTLSPVDVEASAASSIVLVIVLSVLAVSTAVVCVRERLFTPVPTAPRVARGTSLNVADYLGPWHRRAPTVLLAAAAVALIVACIVAPFQAVTTDALVGALASGALAAAVYVVGRWAERRVLAQPQPASSTLELAWDDLFRTDALSNLRMGEAIGAWVPLAWSGAILVEAWTAPQSSDPVAFFPWWGVVMIQVLYPFGAGKLRPKLYPEELRRPAWHPGTATA